jgi:hypothetical protein
MPNSVIQNDLPVNTASVDAAPLSLYTNLPNGAAYQPLQQALEKLLASSGLSHATLRTSDKTPVAVAHRQFTRFRELLDSLVQADTPQPDLLLLVIAESSATSDTQTAAASMVDLQKMLAERPLQNTTVVVAGYSEPLLQAAMEAGANDCILLPSTGELMRLRLQAQLRASQVHKIIQAQNQAITDNHAHVLHEQHMAKAVFDKVARDSVELKNIRHWLSPIAVFNGDVFLATPTPSGNLMVLLGDFTGHGLGAAIGAIPLASTFYSMAEKGFSLRDVAKELNSKLHDILPVGVFCCASIVQLDFSRSLCEVWNAGLPDCYVLKADDASLLPIASEGLPLGVLASDQLEIESQRIRMKKGDKLYLLSDGLLETENASAEQYGELRLQDTLVKSCKQPSVNCFDAVKRDVHAFIGDSQRLDDISFVEVAWVAAQDFEEFYAASSPFSQVEPISWRFEYEARADTIRHQDPVPKVLHILLEETHLRRFSGNLFSILSELYNNALDHGLLKLNSALKKELGGFEHFYNERVARLKKLEQGSITFRLDYQAHGDGGELIVEVEDSGKGFDYQALTHPEKSADAQLYGRGIALLQSICESVEFLGSGNRVRARYLWRVESA